MTIALEISMEDNGALERISHMAADLQDKGRREAARAAGKTAATDVRNHLRTLQAKPEKHGWPARGFWAQINDVVGMNLTDDGAAVTVADMRFWRKLFGGGPYGAKTAKNLTLPVTGAAYGAGSPAEGRVPVELAVVWRRVAGALKAVGLADDVRTSKKGRKYAVGAEGSWWYRLVKAVNPPPDPDTFPDEVKDRIHDHVRTAVSGYITRYVRSVLSGGGEA